MIRIARKFREKDTCKTRLVPLYPTAQNNRFRILLLLHIIGDYVKTGVPILFPNIQSKATFPGSLKYTHFYGQKLENYCEVIVSN